MKKLVLMFSALALIACQDNTKKKDASNEMQDEKQKEIIASADISYASFGEKIDKEGVISASEMKEKFTSMKTGDTLDVKFKTEVEKVCKKKGCWMSVKLDDSLTSFVRFKDYSFFVPLNAEERETILEGKAFVTETSVDELRHYAKDAGKSKEEIAAITESKTEYAFMATGVLMEEPTQE
ncbi:DUF4920 domain-containing protein [Mesonia ostreae]|uniref:DUF4920 domain-containing protein n=1 Tax=Mesonia ostreae TaxID=861110 RepID=A0ABU2KEC4_9FLAO|nr:DUF4920 domain-containing protein [Mesonia ostreae]MDT0293061.1 DUF4920 domain-containing protein [Mesonia ostreae]